MTALVCFTGPIMTQLMETAPDSVTPIPINRYNFDDVMNGIEKSLDHERLIFVMGDLKMTMALFRIVPPQYFKEFKHVIMIFADSMKPQWNKPLHQLAMFANQVVLMDRYTGDKQKKIIRDVYLPIHKKHWYNGEKKDVGLSFYGSTKIYPERKEVIEFLKGAGVDIVYGGGEENQFPLDMMHELRRSKITLNFGNCLSGSQHDRKKFQIKGRIWEAMMAKAVVIEPRNPETAKLFTSDEIMWYDDMKEIPAMVDMLLHDHAFRDYMAENAYQKAKKYADPEYYWGKLL